MGSGFTERERWEFVARTVLSLIVLVGALIAIFGGPYPDAVVKWAFGIIGVILGYWLR